MTCSMPNLLRYMRVVGVCKSGYYFLEPYILART